MMATIPHLFAIITAKLEDLHAIAVDGQQDDNSADMQGLLLSQLRSGVTALNSIMSTLSKSRDAELQ